MLGIRSLAKNLANVPGRKSVVLFTAGFPLTSEFQAELTATISACNQANVAIYPLDVRGLISAMPGPPPGAQLLRDDGLSPRRIALQAISRAGIHTWSWRRIRYSLLPTPLIRRSMEVVAEAGVVEEEAARAAVVEALAEAVDSVAAPVLAEAAKAVHRAEVRGRQAAAKAAARQAAVEQVFRAECPEIQWRQAPVIRN